MRLNLTLTNRILTTCRGCHSRTACMLSVRRGLQPMQGYKMLCPNCKTATLLETARQQAKIVRGTGISLLNSSINLFQFFLFSAIYHTSHNILYSYSRNTILLVSRSKNAPTCVFGPQPRSRSSRVLQSTWLLTRSTLSTSRDSVDITNKRSTWVELLATVAMYRPTLYSCRPKY